jgi:hypothetical protein
MCDVGRVYGSEVYTLTCGKLRSGDSKSLIAAYTPF